jgi:hypothetical protein
VRCTKAAMASPISCGESSWMKCAPGTVMLIRPGPAELSLGPGEDRTRLGIYEQLGHVALGQPPRVIVHYAYDVLRRLSGAPAAT